MTYKQIQNIRPQKSMTCSFAFAFQHWKNLNLKEKEREHPQPPHTMTRAHKPFYWLSNVTLATKNLAIHPRLQSVEKMEFSQFSFYNVQIGYIWMSSNFLCKECSTSNDTLVKAITHHPKFHNLDVTWLSPRSRFLQNSQIFPNHVRASSQEMVLVPGKGNIRVS